MINMAKKKMKVVLENIELRPQVIGYTIKKKSNIGRVIFIFVVFAATVFYINDISLFINNLLGKTTAETIQGGTSGNKPSTRPGNNVENEVVYNIFSNTLEVKEGNIKLNNFNLSNNVLTFDIVNNTNASIDLTGKKFFIETFNESKTLLERHKVDIKKLASGAKISYELNTKYDFHYIVLEEKTIEDYPVVNLKKDEFGTGTITCNKGIEKIVYTFKTDELYEIEHTITENDINAENYYVRYSAYQSKVTSYNNVEGITGTFNSSLNGYTAVFKLNLVNANLGSIDEKYYYSYREIPKVVKFEMQTYGFNCN